MYQIIEGRYIDRDNPSVGRFSREQVNGLLFGLWSGVDDLLKKTDLKKYTKIGNRQNVYFAIITLAGYRAFLDSGIKKEYATELISDAGWKIFASMIVVPRFLARLFAKNRQKQMNLILRFLLFYPFSSPALASAPGYHSKTWSKDGKFYTYWYECPPHNFFKENAGKEEIDYFYKTWCTFDFSLAKEMVPNGRYERPHCLSLGDNVCDMCWYAKSKYAQAISINHAIDE
ncbi:MAG: L-2-amino-thiazoline-4-carboxylic acid hydrolase [Deltaproteobacteria bacterium]|nr:L-2-amino-thiazoline-4-carboxylic acid hydrolase [Deltaproteobacteria bacterium]MCL5276228.1 L-2-amino-thiazoline-4-carboxylic acid hydrolase [Deltaproteobacteria bacterium]